MSEEKAKQSILNLERALLRLKEALDIAHDNQLMIDGTIQRFEFVIELFWKTLKRLLYLENIQVKTPKEALKEAFQIGWLKNESSWLEMVKDRNHTSHIYDEEMASKIFLHIKKNYHELEETFDLLKKRYSTLLEKNEI